MAIVTGTLVSNSKKKAYIFKDLFSSLKKVKTALNKNLTYRIGIDQSTTCTGVSLKSIDNNVILICDVFRLDTDKSEYRRYLATFLTFLLEDLTVDFCIIEDNLWLNNQHTNRVLSSFRSFVEKTFSSIPETMNLQVDKIKPTQWRSKVVDKEKGKGRFNKKESTVEDLCDEFPLLIDYAKLHYAKDSDSFDALGILIGGERYLFNDEGEKLASIAKTKKDMVVLFQKAKIGTYDKYISNQEYLAEQDQSMFLIADEIKRKFKYEELFLCTSYNYDESIYSNVFQIGYTDKVCATLIDSSCRQLYALTEWCFNYDWNISQGYELIMFTFPKSLISNTMKKLETSKFDFYDVLDRYALGCQL